MTQFIQSHTIDEMIASMAAYLPGGEMFIAAQVEGTNTFDLLKGLGFALLDAENFIKVYNPTINMAI